VDRFDVRAQLPLLRAPTLVVHALGDAIQPIEQGRILASEIPDARFLPLDSRNHIPLPQQGSWAHMMQETGQFLENMCRAR
jgi:pimeloyl-ACP methyl ester carboxylesterase